MNFVKILNDKELERISGGSFWESEAGEGSINYVDLYRCGITLNKGFFSGDTYTINGKTISKEMAGKLAEESRNLWESSYKESGDFVGFAREWKTYMQKTYNISWNGKMGCRNSGF